VYVFYQDQGTAKQRNTTADSSVTLDSGKDGAAGGWED
jgi:hypothetical protein